MVCFITLGILSYEIGHIHVNKVPVVSRKNKVHAPH